MNISRSKNARRGSTVLAAVMLVAAVGIVSATLQYVNPPAPEAQTAQAAAPTPAFIDATGGNPTSQTFNQPSTVPTPPAGNIDVYKDARCNNPATREIQEGERKGDLLCSCVEVQKTETVEKSSTTGVNFKGLPSCKYKMTTKDGKTSVEPEDKNAYSTSKSKPNEPYSVNGVPSTAQQPEKPQSGAKTGGSAQDAAKTAAAMLNDKAAGREGDANNKANEYAKAGGDLNALADELKKQGAAAPPEANARGVPQYANEMAKQLQALAGMGAGSAGGGNAGGTPTAAPSAGGAPTSAGLGGLGTPSGGQDLSGPAQQCAINPQLPQCSQQHPTPISITPCITNPSAPGCASGPYANPGANTFSGLNGLLSGGMGNGVMSFLSGMMRGFMGGYGYGGYGMGGYGAAGGIPAGNTIPYQQGTCATQYMCSGQLLMYRNNQCVDQPMQRCQYGCNGNQCAQQQNQGQYGYGTDGQPCMQPPTQPAASACTGGAWRQTVAGNQCVTGWQCVPTSATSAPKATLACAPEVVDAETSFTATFKCENAVESWAGGFNTEGRLEGSTVVAVGTPPSGATNATYTFACRNASNVSVGAQCVVQINRTNIALTAQPATVPAGTSSTIGWTTAGMKSCIISSPDNTAFTEANKSYTNVNGAVQTPALTQTTTFRINCETHAGNTVTTTTQVTVQ